MHTLVLASQSPRRKELLEKAGFSFHTLSVEISEILKKNLILEDALEDLARRKARAVIKSDKLLKGHDYLVLGADTIVAVDSEVLGKPQDHDQAMAFLRKLSDRKHRVITAVCLVDSRTGLDAKGHITTYVQFRKLSEEEIQNYVKSGEPMDKAGAYAIQGLARQFVESIEGPLDNVIGLPVDLVKKLIQENGWRVG